MVASPNLIASHGAVLAERLRRMLKAHVRKSVGSIPTDCIPFFFSSVRPPGEYCALAGRLSKVGRLRREANTPGIAQLAERETVDGYN